MNNQQGGVLSKLFYIPIAVACMVGFFFLGYYVGKQQAGSNRNEIVVPLPEVVSQAVPTSGDYTFFKTLSDRENKTVSIELKPKPTRDAPAPQEKSKPQAAPAVSSSPPREQVVKKEPAPERSASSKIRYTLQTASYQERSVAEHDVKNMKQQGFAAFVLPSEIPGKGTWYRVRLGSFANKGAAERLQKELRSKAGINSFVLIE
jgi:cell division protein FtsN